MNQREQFKEWHTSVYGGDFSHTDFELKEMFAIWQAAQAQQEATVKMLRDALMRADGYFMSKDDQYLVSQALAATDYEETNLTQGETK